MTEMKLRNELLRIKSNQYFENFSKYRIEEDLLKAEDVLKEVTMNIDSSTLEGFIFIHSINCF
jgi:hypothetical protein